MLVCEFIPSFLACRKYFVTVWSIILVSCIICIISLAIKQVLMWIADHSWYLY